MLRRLHWESWRRRRATRERWWESHQVTRRLDDCYTYMHMSLYWALGACDTHDHTDSAKINTEKQRSLSEIDPCLFSVSFSQSHASILVCLTAAHTSWWSTLTGMISKISAPLSSLVRFQCSICLPHHHHHHLLCYSHTVFIKACLLITNFIIYIFSLVLFRWWR